MNELDLMVRDGAASKLFRQWLELPIEGRRDLVRLVPGLSQIRWVELPVDLEKFIEDSRFLGHVPLSPLQFEAVLKASELFDVEAAARDPTQVRFLPDQIVEEVLVWGKGAGKDTIARVIMARVLYLLGCQFSPQETFGMPRYDGIDVLNMAVNADMAEDVFFSPLKRLMADSPWFIDRMQVVLGADAFHLPPVIGKDKKNRDMYAVNGWSGSGSHESFEGKNLLVCVLDEIDAFRSRYRSQGDNRHVGGAITAESMYDAMTTSVQSRFPGIGKMVLVSWPRFAGSFIEQRAAEGRNDPRVYVSGPLATWEVNPTKHESQFADEFRRNPERARAKYMAQPGLAIDRFFTFLPPLLEAFHAELTDDLDVVRSEEDPGPEAPVEYDYGERARHRILSLPLPDTGALYCVHLDLGVTGDRAGLAMAHHVGFIEDVSHSEFDGVDGDQNIGEAFMLPVVSLDLVYWWQGEPGREIDFAGIRAFIIGLARRGYRIVSVTMDGFQSVDMKQILSRYDQYGRRVRMGRDGKPTRTPIEAGYFSLDVKPVGYETLRELIYDPAGRLKAYYCQLLVRELLGLIDIEGGKKIDHTETGSKDVSDAAAGAVCGALAHLREDLRYSPPGKVFEGGGRRDGTPMPPYREKVSRTIKPRVFG